MPRRYNLRKRDEPAVKWVDDDTLEETENDSEHETETETETEDSTYQSEEEEVNEEEEEEEEEEPQRHIQIPMPKKGMRVTIEIDNRSGDYDDYDEYDDYEEEEEESNPFLDYLANKYTPSSRLKKSKKNKDDSPAIDLNEQEQEYFDDLPRSQQKKMKKEM